MPAKPLTSTGPCRSLGSAADRPASLRDSHARRPLADRFALVLWPRLAIIAAVLLFGPIRDTCLFPPSHRQNKPQKSPDLPGFVLLFK
jgi:hypothetical protein